MKKSSAHQNQPPSEISADPVEEKPDSFWHLVYAAVVLTTILVIAALWSFSRYFS